MKTYAAMTVDRLAQLCVTARLRLILLFRRFQVPLQFFSQAMAHTHYTVGGKCIHHQHIMAECSTLREFDARFLYGNCELFIDICVIGQMLVVYWRGT